MIAQSRILDYKESEFVRGSVVGAEGKVIEGHRLFGKFRPEGSRNSEPVVITAEDNGGGTAFNKHIIDYSWLPSAARTYNTSEKISDYILNDIPIVTVPIPNKNMQAFSKSEVTYFDPMLGCPVYKSFRGSAAHFEHDNRDPAKAKGVIFDAVLIPIPHYNTLKISILLGIDRTKDPELARDILSKKRTGWSMGAIVKAFVDSITGQVVTADGGEYKRGNEVMVKGQKHLCYHFCTGSNFFETSTVANPADVTAHGDIVGSF